MKLILTYHWAQEFSGEGRITIPVEFACETSLKCHILDLIKKAYKQEFPKINILGHEVEGIFTSQDIKYFESQIETMVISLDDWYNKNLHK